uniref:EB1 C-terminal domain-containing protein n=1 Tax=Pseudo-nitzschia australis TaxID=44445 RepID=A0A7S4AU85_9STRA
MFRIKSTRIEQIIASTCTYFFAYTQAHWPLIFASFVASSNDFLRSDYEFVANYKLLQAAFTKHRVQRYVDVTKLIRAKYQDNLEFCQWLKAFYDQSGAYHEGYDGAAVRAKGKGGKKYNELMSKSATKGGPSKSMRSNYPTKPRVSTRAQRPTAKTEKPPMMSGNKAQSDRVGKMSKSVTVDPKLATKNAELEAQVSELEVAVSDIEKERDFYFGKLRSIELFLQIKQDKNWEGCGREDVVDNLFKVLYATTEDDVIVDEHGQVVPAVSQDISNKEDISADLSETLEDFDILADEIDGTAE